MQKDFVDFFICNYFGFSDDVFHKWLMQFNIQDFYEIMNELDPDLQFTFEKLTKNINFLDISLNPISNGEGGGRGYNVPQGYIFVENS